MHHELTVALEPGVFERVLRGDDQHLGGAVEVAQALVAEVLGRVEVGHLGEPRVAKARPRQHAVWPRERLLGRALRIGERRLECLSTSPERADDAEPRDGERPHQVAFSARAPRSSGAGNTPGRAKLTTAS
jgi:hypothetical protein